MCSVFTVSTVFCILCIHCIHCIHGVCVSQEDEWSEVDKDTLMAAYGNFCSDQANGQLKVNNLFRDEDVIAVFEKVGASDAEMVQVRADIKNWLCMLHLAFNCVKVTCI